MRIFESQTILAPNIPILSRAISLGIVVVVVVVVTGPVIPPTNSELPAPAPVPAPTSPPSGLVLFPVVVVAVAATDRSGSKSQRLSVNGVKTCWTCFVVWSG